MVKSQGKTFQTRGTSSTKALSREQAWYIQGEKIALWLIITLAGNEIKKLSRI